MAIAAAFVGLALQPITHAAASLVADYPLDGDALDHSGNGFDGTGIDTTFVADPSRGMVASFDGTSSSIDVSASGYSITERPNFQFAISFWFKPTPRDDFAPGGARDVNPIMGAVSSGVIEVVGDNSWPGMGGLPAYGGVGVNSGGGAGSVAAVPGLDVYDGAWHHVVIQWEDLDGVPSDPALNLGSDATVYIDNQLAADVNAQTYNGNSGQASPRMVLGGPVVYSNGGPSDKHYKGLLSDVQFFDGQLTAEEVDALFQQGSVQPVTFAITGVERLPDDMIELTWNSKPGQSYTIFWSDDLEDFGADIADDFMSEGETTTATFENPSGSPKVFFRVGENP